MNAVGKPPTGAGPAGHDAGPGRGATALSGARSALEHEVVNLGQDVDVAQGVDDFDVYNFYEGRSSVHGACGGVCEMGVGC